MELSTIEECPLLADYERQLLRRIDVGGESVSKVAASLGKDKSTISLQRKRALAKLNAWLASKAKPQPGQLASKVFSMLHEGVPLPDIVVKLGIDPDLLLELHKKWLRVTEAEALSAPQLMRLRYSLDWFSDWRRRNCKYVEDRLCKRWGSKEPPNWPLSWYSGIDDGDVFYMSADDWACALCPDWLGSVSLTVVKQRPDGTFERA